MSELENFAKIVTPVVVLLTLAQLMSWAASAAWACVRAVASLLRRGRSDNKSA